MNARKPFAASRCLTLLAAAAALALGACSRSEDRSVGQQVDSAIAKTEQKAEQAKAEFKSEMAQARSATDRATDQMVQKVENAAEKVSSSVADAAVTASINAALARDPKLSALKIDVDTVDGQVRLSGTAPDIVSRDRASSLAAAVKGVNSVDNRLQIGG